MNEVPYDSQYKRRLKVAGEKMLGAIIETIERMRKKPDFEVKQIPDRKFVYEIFYLKTKNANKVVVSAVHRFVTDPDYECLRRKYVPDLDKIKKKNVLLIVNPNGEKITSSPCYYWKPEKRETRKPYILISIHTHPSEPFSSIFYQLGRCIVHEMLHELYRDENVVNEKLSEYYEHFKEQYDKDLGKKFPK